MCLLKVENFLTAFLFCVSLGPLSLTTVSHPFTASEAKYISWLCNGQYSAGCQNSDVHTILAISHFNMYSF